MLVTWFKNFKVKHAVDTEKCKAEKKNERPLFYPKVLVAKVSCYKFKAFVTVRHFGVAGENIVTNNNLGKNNLSITPYAKTTW